MIEQHTEDIFFLDRNRNNIINGRSLSDQQVKNDTSKYYNIRKIVSGQGDDYTTDCLLNRTCFKKHYKLIAIDLRKQQTLGADPETAPQINVTKNLERDESTTIFLLLKRQRKPF